MGRGLVALLVAAGVPPGPLLVGSDEPLERRRPDVHARGQRIVATGIYRDPGRASRGHEVTASARRGGCLRLVVPIPWAARTWVLPVLTALAPAARDHRERGQRHKTLTDWARQLLLVVRRWGRRAPSSPGRTAPTRRWSSWPPAVPGATRSRW